MSTERLIEGNLNVCERICKHEFLLDLVLSQLDYCLISKHFICVCVCSCAHVQCVSRKTKSQMTGSASPTSTMSSARWGSGVTG